MPTLDDVIFRFVGQNELSGPLLQIATDMGLVGKSADGAAVSTGALGSAVGGLATMAGGAVLLGGAVLEAKDALDKASTAQQQNRVFTIALGQSYSQSGTIMKQWSGTMNQVESDTAQSAITVGSMADSYAIAGIRLQSTMKDTMEATTADAYMTGTAVDSVTNGFERMILSGKVLPKTLASFGLSLADLGVTSQQFAADTANERAEIIDAAVAKKGGVSANNAYRDSYQGMIQIIMNAWDNFQIAVGNSLLPVVIPVLQDIATAAMWLAHGIQLIPGPVLAVGLGLVALTGIILIAAGAMTVWSVASVALAGILETDTSVMGIMGGAVGMLTPDFTALTAAITGTDYSATLLGVDIAGTQGGIVALTASTWAAILPFVAILVPIIAVGVAIYEIGNQMGWWTSSLDKAQTSMNAMNSNLQTLTQKQTTAKQAVDDAKAALDKQTAGTPAYITAQKNLAKATSDYATINGEVTKQTTANAKYQAQLTKATNDLNTAYLKAAKAAIAYDLASGNITKSQAASKLKDLGTVVSGNTDSIQAMTDKANALNKTTDEMNTKVPTATGNWGRFGEAIIAASLGKGPMPTATPAVLPVANPVTTPPGQANAYNPTPTIKTGLAALPDATKLDPLHKMLKDIVCVIYGCSPGLIPGFNALWSTISKTWSNISTTFGSAQSVVQPVITDFQGMYTQTNTTMTNLSNSATSILSTMTTSFGNFATGASSAIVSVAGTINSDLGNALNILDKFYCKIAGCSPGLIPAFKLLGKTVPEEVNRVLPHLNLLNGAVGGIGGTKFTATGGNSVINHNEQINFTAKYTTAEMKQILIEVYEGR